MRRRRPVGLFTVVEFVGVAQREVRCHERGEVADSRLGFSIFPVVRGASGKTANGAGDGVLGL